MARVYQSKKVIGYQRPNIEPHEEDTLHEPKGMSFPAVPFNFTAQSNTYLFQNNLPKNQSTNPCLTKIFQEHKYIETNLAKHKALIDEGQKKVIDIWLLNYTKLETLEYSELEFYKNDEIEKYNKLIISCPEDEKDPQYLNYLRVVDVLKDKIKIYDSIQAERDKNDQQAEKDVDNIYNYGQTFNIDQLLRTLQSSFPRREKTREIFFKKYGERLDVFVKFHTSIFSSEGFYWSMAQAYLEVGKLRPADKFYIAVKGKGTDEGNVYFAMREAHAYGVDKLENDIRNEYPGFESKGSGLLHTGWGNDIWIAAQWIDSETSSDSDERIKMKALLSFGQVRPLDEIRMALKGDTSKGDLINALRKANAENLIEVREKNNDKCLADSAEKKMVSQKLLDDYKFSYGGDLMTDIQAIYTTYQSNHDGDEIVDSTISKVVDEKGLAIVNKIISGEETKDEQWLNLMKSGKRKEAFNFYLHSSTDDQSIILSYIFPILVENTKTEFQFTDIEKTQYERALDNDNQEGFSFLKNLGLLNDSKKILNYFKYSANRMEIEIFNNYYNNLKDFRFQINMLLGNSNDLLLHRILAVNQPFYQLLEALRVDENWANHLMLHIYTEEEKKAILNDKRFNELGLESDVTRYIDYFMNGMSPEKVAEKHADKEKLKKVTGLLTNDITFRVKAERSLLEKANSGLGASITNTFSTSKLSAENEQRELEVSLEMALWNDEKIDEKEMMGIEKDILDVRETRGNFEEIRNTVESVATIIAQAVVQIAATALIPGAGGILAQAIIGGISSTGSNWVMKGDRYSLNNGLKDMAIGGLNGAMGALGNIKVAQWSSGEGSFSSILKQSKLLQETVENSIGNSHELIIDAVEGKSPDEIFKNHLKSVGIGIVTNRITQLIESKIKRDKDSILEDGQSNLDTESISAQIGEGGITQSSYDVKHPKDWTDQDFIEYLKGKKNWDEAIDELKMVGGDELAFRLHKIRAKLQYELIGEGAAPLSDASNDVKSDVDLNIEGDNAGKILLKLEKELAEKYGLTIDEVKKMFKLEFFTDAPSRLGRYQQLQGKVSRDRYEEIVSDITFHQETYQYAKMLREAQGEHAFRIETIIHGRPDESIIRKLATLSPSEIKAQREKLLKEIDKLVARSNSGKLKPKDREKIDIQISKKQAELNFYSNDAYISFGAMTKKPQSSLEMKGSMLSQLQMIQSKIATYGAGEAAKGYEVYKYIKRYLEYLEASGIALSPKMLHLKRLSNEIYPSGNFSRTFYESYAVNRSNSERHYMLVSFWEEAHNIVNNTDWENLNFDPAKAAASLTTP
ncbi:MAG: hypothetical protein KDC31_10505 [Saprospiraceae bacterium]|nr:hypothetical protein [Saprospiraceae bacterium]MBX7179743.1 hypothetical protein [Saprospiraceae bacterium]MCB0591713.1 hypothetical protein [Saprospiraceae bacterium]MCO5284194.1 hypothetical protein [Saprospiraceae bacterium]MCO6472020.1 hypothetical protein [Saprospiraceae bacterium]